MSLYGQFSNEKVFREKFVKPLLNKLGFFLVTDYHGRREFGKDFVFLELHRFGLRHCGAQVKNEKTIGLGKTVDDLLTDIEQAFANPFKLPDYHQESYISEFYIFNSGSITHEAKDDLISRLRKKNYGNNIYLLDGDRLDSLNKWATYQNDQNIRQRLSGLTNTLFINIKIWESMKIEIEKGSFREARGVFLFGIESFLSSPIFPEHISENDLMQLWQTARIVNAINNRYLMGTKVSEEIKKQDIKNAIQLIDRSISYARKLIVDIKNVTFKLKPL